MTYGALAECRYPGWGRWGPPRCADGRYFPTTAGDRDSSRGSPACGIRRTTKYEYFCYPYFCAEDQTILTHLTLHEGSLERGPPLVQGGGQLVPQVVHVLEFGPQFFGLVRVRVHKVGAAQVDGQHDALALVPSPLQLLDTRRPR